MIACDEWQRKCTVTIQTLFLPLSLFIASTFDVIATMYVLCHFLHRIEIDFQFLFTHGNTEVSSKTTNVKLLCV